MIEFLDTGSVSLIKSNATDLDCARAAWVSTKGADAREEDSDRVKGLINYLVRERHGSVFEHGSFTFLVECPIFVAREFHRHRAGWSYNELSGRYSELKPKFYLPAEGRNLVQSGKPGHYTFSGGTDEQERSVSQALKLNSIDCWDNYQALLRKGVAKEVARMVLPLNIFTAFYATCNPRSLMHFLGLRTESDDATLKSHPQHEIQQVADQMENHLKKTMPTTYSSWVDNGRMAP